jgi:hypothetical protein
MKVKLTKSIVLSKSVWPAGSVLEAPKHATELQLKALVEAGKAETVSTATTPSK